MSIPALRGSRSHHRLRWARTASVSRGWSAAERLAIVRQDQVATFLLKKSPFTAAETARLRSVSAQLGFDVLYAPDATGSAPGLALSALELGAGALRHLRRPWAIST